MKKEKGHLVFSGTLLCLVCIFFWLTGAAVQAAAEDKPMICAASEAIVCPKDAECFRGPVDRVNLPLFFKVDLEQKKIYSLTEGGQVRTSAITSVSKEKGVLILQGAEDGSGWSVVINEADGTMTVTSAKGEEAFVVFGACTSSY